MNRRDIKRGMTVYHNIFTHWGPGCVIGIVAAGSLERLFERGSLRVLVRFESHDKPVRLQIREIRKTPNRKKIKQMVDLYQRRGTNAIDGRDRLILPPKDSGLGDT